MIELQHTTISGDGRDPGKAAASFNPAIRCVAIAVSFLCLAAAEPSAAASPPTGDRPMTMQTDLAKRERAIHWPPGFEPEKADLFAHNALLIDAPCEIVWGHIVDAARWPEWYPNAKDVKLSGGAKELGADTVWRWTTFGLAIESRVNEFVPYSRLGWFGYAPGKPPAFYHTWYLAPQGAGCLVSMDEAGIGADAAGLRRSDKSLMHRGHDLWLATLKWVSEAKR
jgi:hypothetical protein